MDIHNELFMEAFGASISDKKVQLNDVLSADEWTSLFSMANVHHVLPMVYEVVYDNQSLAALGPGYTMQIKRQVIQDVSRQTMRTNEFQMLYEYLGQNGITPCIVKGIVCRNLYPNSDARISSDEDVFIPKE